MGLYKVLIVVGALVAIAGCAIAVFGVSDKDGIECKKGISLLIGLILSTLGGILIGLSAELLS